MNLLRAGIAAAVLAAGSEAARADEARLPQVDLERYAGKWYELARTPNHFEDNTPTRDGETYSACRGATARYTIREPGTIEILNACVRTAPSGARFEDVAEGVGHVASERGSRLRIAFGPPLARFFQRLVTLGGSPYWIYAVGEGAPGEPYRWSVVSGPDRDFIFLLTRERVPPSAVLEEVVGAARAAGLPVERLVFAQQ